MTRQKKLKKPAQSTNVLSSPHVKYIAPESMTGVSLLYGLWRRRRGDKFQ